MGKHRNKTTDPATVQAPYHFKALRFHQRLEQVRDYERITGFVGTRIAVTYPEDRTGYRAAPVAIFTELSSKGQRMLYMRDLTRLYRLAKADALEEARMLPAPGPASVFLEIARQPYEEMRAMTRECKFWPAPKAY